MLSAHGSLRIASASRWLEALVPFRCADQRCCDDGGDDDRAGTSFFICAPPVCGKTISPLPVTSTREDRERIGQSGHGSPHLELARNSGERARAGRQLPMRLRRRGRSDVCPCTLQSPLDPPVADPDETTADLSRLQRVAARDSSALAELYDEHSRLLFGLILRILKDRGEAEEVLQEVFVQAWTRASTYNLRARVTCLGGCSASRAIARSIACAPTVRLGPSKRFRACPGRNAGGERGGRREASRRSACAGRAARGAT